MLPSGQLSNSSLQTQESYPRTPSRSSQLVPSSQQEPSSSPTAQSPPSISGNGSNNIEDTRLRLMGLLLPLFPRATTAEELHRTLLTVHVDDACIMLITDLQDKIIKMESTINELETILKKVEGADKPTKETNKPATR